MSPTHHTADSYLMSAANRCYAMCNCCPTAYINGQNNVYLLLS